MDGFYKRCLELACMSPCQKRGFGCLLVKERVPTIGTYNQPITCAESLCSPTCVRLSMKSGVDPLIGSCGHAEESAIWLAINDGWSVKKAVLYVAGVLKSGDIPNVPLVLDEPQFYCLRCATAMYYAGITGVHVWVKDHWAFMTTQQAYDSSLSVALGKDDYNREQR